MHALNHDGNLLYVELAADKDADSDDREQWAKANPSYPKRTSEQAIMRMRNNLSEDSFRREALGIWGETATAYAISPDLWQAAAIDDVPEGGTVSFGIDMPPDRSVLTIGAALRYADVRQSSRWRTSRTRGRREHVGRGLARRTLAEDRQRGHRRAVARHEPAARTEESTCEGHGHEHAGDGPSMRPVPRHAQSRNAQAPRDEYQPQLAAAVKGATTRPLGQSGAIAWNKLGSDVDITPLVSTTLALYGAFTTKRHPGRRQEVMF